MSEQSEPLEIKLAGRLGEVKEYYFSKKLREIDRMREEGREIINLGIGSPDLPPHPEVIAALCESARRPDTHAYQPYKGINALREAFARWYGEWYGVGLDPVTEVMPLIGSKEGVMHVCMTYLEKGDRVLIPNPGYPTYRSAATIAGGECVEYRLTERNGWMPDFGAIERGGLERVKMMILNYPQMPTGALPEEGLFDRLVAFAKKHNILLVHDNPYSFIRNDRPRSLLSAEGAMDVAVELNSLSKSHNMAGWRMGMIAGNRRRIDEILRFKSNMDSGMFYPMQIAAVRALALGREWYEELNGVYLQRQSKAYELLDLLGCTYGGRQAGLFVWARIPEGAGDCYAYSDRILEKTGVFITPGGIFGSEGNHYLRVSLCAAEETLQRCIDKIKKEL